MKDHERKDCEVTGDKTSKNEEKGFTDASGSDKVDTCFVCKAERPLKDFYQHDGDWVCDYYLKTMERISDHAYFKRKGKK